MSDYVGVNAKDKLVSVKVGDVTTAIEYQDAPDYDPKSEKSRKNFNNGALTYDNNELPTLTLKVGVTRPHRPGFTTLLDLAKTGATCEVIYADKNPLGEKITGSATVSAGKESEEDGGLVREFMFLFTSEPVTTETA